MPQKSQDLSVTPVLAIFAHPNDEGFVCGGTLAMLVARGARVTLKSVWTLLITKFDKFCYKEYP
jgi:LmbE family N-acetylglucosaminyl deacetylase